MVYGIVPEAKPSGIPACGWVSGLFGFLRIIEKTVPPAYFSIQIFSRDTNKNPPSGWRREFYDLNTYSPTASQNLRQKAVLYIPAYNDRPVAAVGADLAR